MSEEQKDSFISRFLFRKGRSQLRDLVAPATEPLSDLAWATNGGRSVRHLVHRALQGEKTLIVTGYQDFLSAMSIILQVRPDISSSPPGTIRIIFGTNMETRTGFEDADRPLCQKARDHFLESRGLSLRSLDELRAVLAYDAILSKAISLRVFDVEMARERFGRGFAMLHAKLFIGEKATVAGSANFSLGGLVNNLEYVDDLQAFPHLAEQRRETAETFWSLGVDWTEQALEILRGLLRPVSPEEALARTVHEMLSFPPWRVGGDGAAGRPPLPFQRELVYEAAGTTYEHGFVFVEAPTGAGKTDIGKHLATVLPAMHSSVVLRHGNERPDLARTGAIGIVPTSVFGNWNRRKPANFTLIKLSHLSRSKIEKTEEIEEINRGVRASAAMVVDESHRLHSRYLSPSRRSLIFEQIPAIWTSCLSATLMGNHGLDGLLAFHERRASIYVPPEITDRINATLRRGRERSHQLNRIRQLQDTLESRRQTGMDDLFRYEEDLEEQIRAAEKELKSKRLDPREIQSDMADALAPYVVRRQRHCVGESEERGAEIFAYPRIESTRIDADLSPVQSRIIDEIRTLAESIMTGTTLVSANPKRADHTEILFHDKSRIHIRNFLAILRSSITFARQDWTLKGKNTGENLRKAEMESRWSRVAKKKTPLDNKQIARNKEVATPICDRIERLLHRPELDRIDEQRARAMIEMLDQFQQVIFLSERIGVLDVYARLVSGMDSTTEVILVDSSRKPKPGGNITVVGDGESAQDYLALDGRKAREDCRRAMFMTFQMAEGINLQRARALGIIGVTSDIKSMLQGLGRIDRIDSPHSTIHYTTFDLPSLVLSSDRKARSRIESIALLSGVGAADIEEASLEFSAGDLTDLILEQHRKPRPLRSNNFYDLVEGMRRELPEDLLQTMERITPRGTWGADLCFLAGKSPVTILSLTGRTPSFADPSCFPPRLLAILEKDEGREIVRDQPEVGRILSQAYGETVQAGMHRAPPTDAELSVLIDGIHPTLEGIRHWDIRPERTVSLLGSLADFLSDEPSKNQGHGYDLFGHLTLNALEKLAEAWALELDPLWIEAKKEVNHLSASQKQIPDYLGLEAIHTRLEDLPSQQLSEIRARMEEVRELAEQASRGADTGVLDRIAVVFGCGMRGA